MAPGVDAGIHLDIGDVEIIIDENGEIIDLAIHNATKHLNIDEISYREKLRCTPHMLVSPVGCNSVNLL